MYTKEIKALIARLEEIKDEFLRVDWDSEEFEELEDEVYDIEEELTEFSYEDYEPLIDKALRLIDKIKKENEFYDSEDDLDLMFDEEFDEEFDDEFDDFTSYDDDEDF